MRIANDGPRIRSTDYWRTEHARGYCYLSVNAGAVRLLVPPPRQGEIVAALRTAARASIYLAGARRVALHRVTLILEDDSDAPYVLDVDAAQTDRALPPGEAGRWVTLLVYGPATDDPEGVALLATLPLLIRGVAVPPDLSPLPPVPVDWRPVS